MRIHPTALVHPKAHLEEEVIVGPWSVIEEGVIVGRGTRIGERVTLTARTVIGENCSIYQGVVIGTPPQDLKYKGAPTRVVIGNNNIIREYVTIHRATGEGNKTIIGDNNFLMAYSHIAHNCLLGNFIILSHASALGGHILVEDRAIIGGLSAVHQYVRIGTLSIIGAGSKVVKDVPPYLKVDGHPIKVYGLNTLGLRRYGIPPHVLKELKMAYRILFRSHLNTSQALEKLREGNFSSLEVRHLINFVHNSQRGICK